MSREVKLDRDTGRVFQEDLVQVEIRHGALAKLKLLPPQRFPHLRQARGKEG
jgi:hypothetical protein